MLKEIGLVKFSKILQKYYLKSLSTDKNQIFANLNFKQQIIN